MAKASGGTRTVNPSTKYNNITEQQKSALNNYIYNNDINSDIRVGMIPDDSKYLDELMKPSDKEITLFRGINANDEEDWGMQLLDAEKGDILTDKGYISTSSSLTNSIKENYLSLENPVILRITASKGVKMIDINKTYKKAFNKENTYESEKEILLHRNSKMEVTKSEFKNGVKYIYAKIKN